MPCLPLTATLLHYSRPNAFDEYVLDKDVKVAKFAALDPNDVSLGRSRGAAAARQPYIEALRSGDAGRIEVERGERPSTVKGRLSAASKELGVRVRSSWEDPSQKALLWKKVGS